MGSPRTTDDGLARLRGLTKLKTFFLGGPPSPRITGAGLVHFAGMRELESLCLQHSGVERLDALGPAPRMESLIASGSRIDDAGLAPVARWGALKSLSLGQTPVGDAGLAHLVGLSRLEGRKRSFV